MEDLIVQGEQIRDTLQELQDAVHLTKVLLIFWYPLYVHFVLCIHHNHFVLQANIFRHNEEALKKINKTHNETMRSNYSGDYEQKDPIDGSQLSSTRLSLGSGSDDSEMPMPPLALAPLQTHNIRYKLQRTFC